MNSRPTFSFDRRTLSEERKPAGPQNPSTPLPLRTLDSGELFQGAHEIVIDHVGALYRLKITRQGKLILNK